MNKQIKRILNNAFTVEELLNNGSAEKVKEYNDFVEYLENTEEDLDEIEKAGIQEYTGYTREELEGKSVKEVYEILLENSGSSEDLKKKSIDELQEMLDTL